MVKMKKNAFAAASAVMAISLGLAGAAEAATIRVVALTGQEAPGTGGAVFSSFNSDPNGGPALNDAGEVAFRAAFDGPGVTDASNTGIFTSGALVAREGDVAPGAGGAQYQTFFGDPALNNAGETAFRASLAAPFLTPANNRGIFTSSAQIARLGDAAPGAGGAEFTVFIWNALLNDAGQVAYRARISPAGPMDASDSSIFSGDTLVANVGDPVPGIGGAVFESLWDPMLNSAGETAFTGIFSGPGVTDADNRAIFNSGGPLLRTGDAAPGIGGAVITGLNLSRPGLNDAGELAFGARIAGAGVTEDDDVFLFAAGAPVAREGNLAPGAGGAVFDEVFQPGLNNAGDVVADVRLRGAGVTSDNENAIFATRGGAFEMILREGDLLDIGGGELRPILSFSFAHWSGFNENGDIAFFADLGPIAGGGGAFGIGPGAVGQGISGIFVYEADRIPPPSVVPLPPAVGLMLVGMAALGAIGRRRGGTSMDKRKW
jgi:hypothetical protein